MPSLKGIRRRIQAVRGTQKVTRAMKLVAAAKLRRAQQSALEARAYAMDLHDATMRVSRRLGERAPVLWQRPKRIDCIDVAVVASDRGLCGGFNENLLRLLEENILLISGYDIRAKLYVIGRKGVRYLKACGHDVEEVPDGDGEEGAASWIADRLIRRYRTGQTTGGNIGFNRLVSAARQEITFWNLLPLYKQGSARERHLEYRYEPGRKEALEYLCRESIRSTIVLALRESYAAEQSARMMAMDNATRNAEDVIAHLTFVYNRARQEAITRELIDIVGGAQAVGG